MSLGKKWAGTGSASEPKLSRSADELHVACGEKMINKTHGFLGNRHWDAGVSPLSSPWGELSESRHQFSFSAVLLS